MKIDSLRLIVIAFSFMICIGCTVNLSVDGSDLVQTAGVAASTTPSEPPIKVMVLGTYHMSNPGQDVVNMDVDNVLVPERQAELAALAEALLAFRPTVVAVEARAAAPEYTYDLFQEYSTDMLAKDPNERVQIGLRLAEMAGLDVVYAVDEQASDLEPDYFPCDAVVANAKIIGRDDRLNKIITDTQEMVAEFSAKQATSSIAELLLELNTGPMSSPDFYYQLFEFDSGEDQPGAELQAYWFMRNAKIFSKILQVSEPGDRVVVVFGAGHRYWLEHLARETPGVEFVDPAPYLRAAVIS